MATNYPGPYGLRLFYTTVVSSVPIQHQAEYNIDLATPLPSPGDPFASIAVKNQGGATGALDAAVDGWVSLVQPILSAGGASTIDYAELWEYTPESFEAEFVSTYDISLAGTSGSGTQIASQDIYSFRTVEGGILKLNFMESVASAGARQTYAALAATQKAIVDYMLSNSNFFLGRDTSYPFAFIARYPGQNEALFKRRLRPT